MIGISQIFLHFFCKTNAQSTLTKVNCSIPDGALRCQSVTVSRFGLPGEQHRRFPWHLIHQSCKLLPPLPVRFGNIRAERRRPVHRLLVPDNDLPFFFLPSPIWIEPPTWMTALLYHVIPVWPVNWVVEVWMQTLKSLWVEPRTLGTAWKPKTHAIPNQAQGAA